MWYTLKDFHPIRGPKEDTKETTKRKTQTWGPWLSMQTQKMNKKGYTTWLNIKTQKMAKKRIQTSGRLA